MYIYIYIYISLHFIYPKNCRIHLGECQWGVKITQLLQGLEVIHNGVLTLCCRVTRPFWQRSLNPWSRIGLTDTPDSRPRKLSDSWSVCERLWKCINPLMSGVWSAQLWHIANSSPELDKLDKANCSAPNRSGQRWLTLLSNQSLSFILYGGYSHSAPCFTVVSDLGEVRVFDGAKYFSTKKGNTFASNHQGLLEYSPIEGELIILNKPGSIAPQKTNQPTIINHHLPSCINYIRIFGGGGLNPYYMVIQILS